MECEHCWHVQVETIYRNAVVRVLVCCHCGAWCTKVNGDDKTHGPHAPTSTVTKKMDADYA